MTKQNNQEHDDFVEEAIDECRIKFDLAKASAGKEQSMTSWLKDLLTRHRKHVEKQERERLVGKILDKFKYDLFPVQIKMENPGYWNGYTDTIFKVKDIIINLINKS